MTDKPVKVSQDIIDMAREAKSFIAGSGEASLPDENLMRAAVTFNMLQRPAAPRWPELSTRPTCPAGVLNPRRFP